MSLSFTVGSGGVPVGSYTATFQGVEPQPENKERGYGIGIRWKLCRIDAIKRRPPETPR